MSIATFKTLIQAVQGMGWQAALRAVQYNNTLRSMDRRFAPKKPRGRFRMLGSVTGVEQGPRGALIHTEQGALELHVVAPDIVRVRVHTESNFPPPFSYAVHKIDWPQPAVQVDTSGQSVVVSTEQLVCRVDRETGRITFSILDGRVISEDAEGLAWRGNEVRWTRKLPPNERSYGLGQRASDLNLRGKRLTLWNGDPLPDYARDVDPVYYSIPFYLGVQPDLVFGVLWDNPARGYVDLGTAQADEMSFGGETGELRFYLMVGATIEAVLKQYTELTGHMPLPPMWALGFHQSRWGYDSEAVYRDLAEQFRARKLPCDVLYFDIDYMDGFRTFTWDRQRFPLLPGLLSDLEGQGFKAVAIVDPGIKVDEGYEVYQQGTEQEVFLKYPNDKPVVGPVWPGKCEFPDFSSARVRSWWADHIPVLLRAGFAGIWNDMNEPTAITFQPNGTLADYVKHDWDNVGQTHVGGGHNTYGMLMARATREGIEKSCPRKRPFVLTRATYAGGQRYAASWTGDNGATWEHLRLSIPMVLNAGLSGLPFTGPDIGGFAGDTNPELYARWMQLGSLMPYFRSHTAAGTASQEPWCFGDQIETIARRYLELRYQLLPYLYAAFARNAQEGLPMVRPLFMEDPSDDNLRGINDAFMVGEAILAAPIVELGATQREIYLPRGAWYEYDTGKLIDGARTVTVDAPLEKMPIYIRAGKVIPMWPVLQYVGEQPLEEARLRVYAGSGDTTHYEDEGEGMAYQTGDYRWSYFTCKFLPSGQFAIDWRRAGTYQPPYAQVRVEVVGIPIEPEMVTLDGQNAPIWYYEAGIVEFIVKPFNEARIIGRDPSSSGAQRTLVRKPRD
ncbi:MAG: glycoside hydrolase family 31 protein [Anaerolineae bacterium]|nr:glycoside hydrolase family 31 protein [Anaerolineae bacterium]